jgi:hypothetical protein
MFAAAYGFLGHVLDSAGLSIILAAALLAVGGLRQRRLRIQALQAWYANPLPYPPVAPAGSAAVTQSHPASGWPSTRRLRFTDGVRSGGPHPLILVCASGGGIRAAAWTAAILEQLDTYRGFRGAVRLVTGASGGMVGATAWVAHLHHGRDTSGLVDAVAGDSLSPLAHRLVFHDIPFAFLPLLNANNRGQALEDAWNAHAGGILNVPLGALRDREREGALPSLVFTPMVLEDGRRLVISNLDLSSITANEVRWVRGAGTASLSAFHLEDLLPEALERLPLATAARLTASYPYVTPAPTLPTEPSRRVGDAGYYDNYGLSLACEWLRECVTSQQSWLRQHVSRVLLVQIRDGVSELSVALDTPRRQDLHDQKRFGLVSAAVTRGFEWLTGPIGGLLSARESVMLFRNDAALEAAMQLCDAAFHPGFLTTTIFEFKGEASLSWYLTRAELDGILAQARSRGIAEKTADVARWLQ